MEDYDRALAARLGGYAALAGSLCGLAGAALVITSGSDMFQVLAGQPMADYLRSAAANSGLLIVNLTLWIFMVLLLGTAATMMSALCERRPSLAQLGRFCAWVGVSVAICAFVAWLAIVVRLAPDQSAAALVTASAIGWFVLYADSIATILIIGVGPTFLALAGRDDWAPTWLVRWSFLTALTGLISLVDLMAGGSGSSTYGFAIVPVGIGWMLAAGVVLLRRAGTVRRAAPVAERAV